MTNRWICSYHIELNLCPLHSYFLINIKNTLKKSQKTDDKTASRQKYNTYIRSKEFKAIREKVFERDHYRCACCGYSPFEDKEFPNRKPRTLQCHHRTYEHLFNEYPEHLDDLVTLCSVCHRAIHRAPSNFVRFKMSDNESE